MVLGSRAEWRESGMSMNVLEIAGCQSMAELRSEAAEIRADLSREATELKRLRERVERKRKDYSALVAVCAKRGQKPSAITTRGMDEEERRLERQVAIVDGLNERNAAIGQRMRQLIAEANA